MASKHRRRNLAVSSANIPVTSQRVAKVPSRLATATASLLIKTLPFFRSSCFRFGVAFSVFSPAKPIPRFAAVNFGRAGRQCPHGPRPCSKRLPYPMRQIRRGAARPAKPPAAGPQPALAQRLLHQHIQKILRAPQHGLHITGQKARNRRHKGKQQKQAQDHF